MKPQYISGLILLLSVFAGCSKEELKPDSNYTGLLTFEYIRSFPAFTSDVSVNLNIYTSGEVVFSDPAQVTYSAEDSLSGNTEIKVYESGIIAVSALNGEWVVKNNAEHLSVNANVLIEGNRKIWNRNNPETEWELTEENSINVENPVNYPLDFKISEAKQTNGSVIGDYRSTPDDGSIIYQWTLRINPM